MKLIQGGWEFKGVWLRAVLDTMGVMYEVIMQLNRMLLTCRVKHYPGGYTEWREKESVE